MKNILKILLFSSVWAIIFMSCSENINEGDEIETYPKDVVMTDYVLLEGCSWDGFLPDTIYLINSQEELTAHLACWANVIIPEIDFEKNSLIVVCGVNTSGIKSISSQLQQTATNAYELTVNIESFLTTVVEEWNVAKLVSKLENNTVIDYFLNGVLKTSTKDSEPYRAAIVGHWKLTEISTVYNSDNENIVVVDYSDSNILYNFRADNTLVITGYVPDDLSEGEHSYIYTKPNGNPLSLPGPNLQIGNVEPVFCIAYKNENNMTIRGEKYTNEGTMRWSKIFVKMN